MQRDANTTCTVEEKEKLVTKAHEFYKLRKSKYLARSSFAHFVQAYLARKKNKHRRYWEESISGQQWKDWSKKYSDLLERNKPYGVNDNEIVEQLSYDVEDMWILFKNKISLELQHAYIHPSMVPFIRI